MLLFRSLKEELALIDLELVNLEIPKFHGKNNEFMGWFSNVVQVFACYNHNNQGKLKEGFQD